MSKEPSEAQACEVPLIEQLRSVPITCREMIEVGPQHHRNIPYGRLCHEAAEALASQSEELRQVRKYAEQRLKWAEDYASQITKLEAQVAELSRALTGMLGNYLELKRLSLILARSDNSGWAPGLTENDDVHVIAARKAIDAAKAKP